MSKQRIIVTVTDGSFATATGIHIVWRSLLRHRNDFAHEWSPVVLYPSWAWPPTQPCRVALRGQRLVEIEQQRHADPYAAKLVLADFISTLPDDSEILYLDYDHVCLAPFDPATPPAGTLNVGSRVGTLRFVRGGDSQERASLLRQLLNGRQYNNSLVHGLCGTLRDATSRWNSAYSDLAGIVDPRVHEEVAFFASAVEAGVDVRPVSAGVQSEWADADSDARLFHYGGESAQALALKRALPTLMHPGGVQQESIDLLSVDAVGRRVLQELVALSNFPASSSDDGSVPS